LPFFKNIFTYYNTSDKIKKSRGKMKYVWEGRFGEEIDKDLIEFTSSITIDRKLALFDIEGSIAHAKMLGKCNIINKEESKKIIDGLEKIKKEFQEKKFEFKQTDEDIHTAIERRLVELVGEVGKKLHTARSRNDQIVLDEKLYLKSEVKKIIELITHLQNVFLKKSEENIDVIIPGYTHLQQSQVILLSYYFLAFIEMFERDKERLENAYKIVDILPLGSCACCGTSLPVDRKYLAELLGFSDISRNAYDTVADRDFIVDVCVACVVFLIHLSRLSEDFIIWNSQEFQFIELPDKFSTGSSIMPQKKNPDIFELIRGRSSSSIGFLTGILTLMKGLPMSYNRDLQEDKTLFFPIIEQTLRSISILIKVIPEIKFNKKIIGGKISDFTLATDIAEYLVQKNIPFREAHNIVGKIVRYCIENKKGLRDLDIEEFKKFSPAFTSDIKKVLDFNYSVNSKNIYGGTSLSYVKKEIEKWKRKLK